MAATTNIAWCDSTFNPWVGCTNVSPGCDHCYAEKYGKRFGVAWGPGQPRRRTSAANWKLPRRWNDQAEREGRRYRVFCASLADVFDNEVPPDWRSDLLALIAATSHLDWLLLTKRIGNAGPMIQQALWDADIRILDRRILWPWPNIWLGATVVNQEEADRDIPKLLATPAAKRFLSIEPMLGPIDLVRGGWSFLEPLRPPPGNTIGWEHGVDWVIVGGESGPGARPFYIGWASSIVKQCRAAGVPVFVKQFGAAPVEDGCEPGHVWIGRAPSVLTRVRDKKGGDLSEWPSDLRVREFPA